MSSYAYYNGSFGKREEIRIPLSDRSVFFGDAIYDAAIGSYDRILWEEEHIERFLGNAEKIGIKHNISKNFLSSLLREIAVRSMLETYFIYFQLSRDLPSRRHSANGSGFNLLITVDPITINKSDSPLRLKTAEDLRYGYCNIKTVNLLPSVLSITEAESNGCDEAVFVKNGFVTECSKSNISIIKQGRLITHPKTNEILPGIAREHILRICESVGITVSERKFSVEEMMNADDILVSSTTRLCQRAGYVNSVPVGKSKEALGDKICSLMYSEYAVFCLK